MKVNSTLEKKLLKYSAMAGGVVAVAGSANAQINYTDLNPDEVITGHQMGLSIDFDGDANDDVTIATLDGSATGTTSGIPYTAYYQAVPVVPGSGAAVMSASTAPAALNVNDAINSAGAFMTAQGSAAYVVNFVVQGYGTFGPYSGGAWLGAVDKYLGVRFTAAGNTHYGWVRMDVDATATTVTVKDYAWNGTADGPILAGQTVGLASISEDLALVRFYNNRLEVKTVNGTNGNIAVVNMEGKVVYNGSINNGVESIDLGNLAAGIYVVNAEFNEGSVQHKIVIR